MAAQAPDFASTDAALDAITEAATSAAAFSAKAKTSFDGATKLGHVLGLPSRQVDHDLDAAASPEPARFLSDPDYFDKTAAVCKALGLM